MSLLAWLIVSTTINFILCVGMAYVLIKWDALSVALIMKEDELSELKRQFDREFYKNGRSHPAEDWLTDQLDLPDFDHN